jgi:hypothetical protein
MRRARAVGLLRECTGLESQAPATLSTHCQDFGNGAATDRSDCCFAHSGFCSVTGRQCASARSQCEAEHSFASQILTVNVHYIKGGSYMPLWQWRLDVAAALDPLQRVLRSVLDRARLVDTSTPQPLVTQNTPDGFTGSL